MSFKSEAANVRAGLSSGSFKKKSDRWAGFFDELSYGIKKQDEEKRQEERIKRQEARAIARSTKAKQDTADALAKKIETNAVRLANQFAGTEAGADAKVIDYFRQNLIATGNDYNGTVTATTALIDSSQLSFTTPQVGTELVSTSGAALDQPPRQRPTDEPPITGPMYSSTNWNYSTQSYEGEDRPLTSEDIARIATQKDADGKPTEYAATAQQMIALELSDAKQEALYAENNYEEVPVFGETTVKLNPYKKPVDLEGLTETNYIPRLRTAELLGKAGAETVKEIKNIAIQSGWDEKINGVSKMDMAGKPSAYFEDLVRNADPTKVSDYTFLTDSLSAAQVREADPKFWEDDVKLATFSANTLEAFINTGRFAEGTPSYEAINSYLTIRRVQEGNADVSALAGAGSQKIDQFILSNKNNLDDAQLNTLTDMRSIALEYEAEGQESATAKQMAQEGYISAQGVEALEGQARFEAMANFEKAWKIATDTTKADPQFWQKPEELAKIDPVVLKTMMDAGLLGEATSEAYQSVEATYNAKSGVLAGDLSQLQGKSVVQFDQYMVSNADYFVDNPEAATEFHKLRSLQLAREKADAPDERLLTAKQIGLDAFMEQNNTSELSGDALMNKMAEFEKIWDAASKEVAAKAETYTTSNYAADLIKFGGMLISENEVDRKTANDWFVTTKPIIDETLASIANLDNQSKIAALVAVRVQLTQLLE